MLNLFRPTRGHMAESLDARGKLPTMAERAEAYKRSVREHVQEYILIALGGRLAGIDGPVNDAEVSAMARIFPMSRTLREHLRPLLVEASQDKVQLAHYVRRLHTFFPANQRLYRDIVQGLFLLANADTPLNVDEIKYLREVSQQFSLPESFFLTQLRETMMPGGTTPFQVLGVARSVSEGELKAAYYKAVRAFHPDKLAYLPQGNELVDIANARIKGIHTAYITIKTQKKFR